MNPGLFVKLRPIGPWRIGPDSGARNKVDAIYHSDSLYAAVTSAMGRLGSLAEWLDATARSAVPEVCFSSCFPFLDEIGFVPPPRTVWPPGSPSLKGARVRWKSARFVPLGIVQAILAGQRLNDDQWTVDGASECLVPAGRQGPFRTGVRWNAAVDRLSGATERHSTACLEFREGAGLWTVVSFRDDGARVRWIEPVQAAFRWLADSGFGGERSRGWGRSEAPEFLEGMLPVMILGSVGQEAGSAVVEQAAAADQGPPVVSEPQAGEESPAAEQGPTAASAPEPQAGQEAAAADQAPTATSAPEPQAVQETAAADQDPTTVSEPEPQAGQEAAAAEQGPTAMSEPEPQAGQETAAADQAPTIASEPEPQAVQEAVVANQGLAVAGEPGNGTPPAADDQGAQGQLAGASGAALGEELTMATLPEEPSPAPPVEEPPPDEPSPVPPVEEPPSEEPPVVPPAPEPEPPVTEPPPQEAAVRQAREIAGTPASLAGPRPPVPGRAHWLLSLFTPAADDRVDWTRGNYTLVTRSGRVDASGELKKQLPMVSEGSVVYAPVAPCGSAPDVAPDGLAHPVFRAGFALSIPLPEVSG